MGFDVVDDLVHGVPPVRSLWCRNPDVITASGPHPYAFFYPLSLIETAIAGRSDQQRAARVKPVPQPAQAAKGKPKAYGQEARGKKCNA